MVYIVAAIGVILITLAYLDFQGGGQAMTFSANITAAAEAIAVQEGFGPAGNLATICNNPGNLTQGDFGDTGVYRSAAGGIQLIVFASLADGWNALYRKLQATGASAHGSYSPAMTILEFVETYTGDHNLSDPALQNYAAAVASAVGASISSAVGDYFV